MNTYKMIWSSVMGSLPWEYTWDMASDTMAIEYARFHTQNLIEYADHVFHTMVVFRAKDCDWEHIATLGLLKRIEVGIIPQ